MPTRSRTHVGCRASPRQRLGAPRLHIRELTLAFVARHLLAEPVGIGARVLGEELQHLPELHVLGMEPALFAGELRPAFRSLR